MNQQHIHSRRPVEQSSNPETHAQSRSEIDSQRPLWIILFTLILLLVSGTAGGSETFRNSPHDRASQLHAAQIHVVPNVFSPDFEIPQTIQYDGVSTAPPFAYDSGSVPPQQFLRVNGGVEHRGGGHLRSRHDNTRPQSVHLAAELANFDADADPDGWRVAVMLLDRQDRAVVDFAAGVRIVARFELIPQLEAWPAVSFDRTRYPDSVLQKPVRWSKQLEFDPHGVATLRLPLRRSLHPQLGWTSIGLAKSRSHRPAFHRTSDTYETLRSNRPGVVLANRPQASFGAGSAWQDSIRFPAHGILSVRVSVPSEGTFEAGTSVRLRP